MSNLVNGAERKKKPNEKAVKPVVSITMTQRTDVDPIFITNPAPGQKPMKPPGKPTTTERRKSMTEARKRMSYVKAEDVQRKKEELKQLEQPPPLPKPTLSKDHYPSFLGKNPHHS